MVSSLHTLISSERNLDRCRNTIVPRFSSLVHIYYRQYPTYLTYNSLHKYTSMCMHRSEENSLSSKQPLPSFSAITNAPHLSLDQQSPPSPPSLCEKIAPIFAFLLVCLLALRCFSSCKKTASKHVLACSLSCSSPLLRVIKTS